MVAMDILRLLVAAAIAFVAGKLIAKLKLPSILGWLIAGMIMGPHALGLLGSSVLDSRWFDVLESLLECTFGLMIGTELIWSKMKKAGKQIVVTTITESVGTFLVVSLVFGVHVLVCRRTAVSGILLRRHRASHSAGTFPFHCYTDEDIRPCHENADPDGCAG